MILSCMPTSSKSWASLIKSGKRFCLHYFKTSYWILLYPLDNVTFQSFYSAWSLIFGSFTSLNTSLGPSVGLLLNLRRADVSLVTFNDSKYPREKTLAVLLALVTAVLPTGHLKPAPYSGWDGTSFQWFSLLQLWLVLLFPFVFAPQWMKPLLPKYCAGIWGYF